MQRPEINDSTIEYISILSKLDLSTELAERAKKDIGDMLAYMDKLQELDTEGVEPLSHVFKLTNVFREDVVTNADESELTLRNAVAVKDNMIVVPKTVDG